MGTFVNNLRLLEITTGDESGTWGTKTNLNLELIADAFGSGTEAITTNADTHTTTIADGAADEGRAIFLKYTGTLDSACTITLAPNTVNKLWFIENATSGSQNIIISQGSGANVTIGNGNVAAVYTDGAGSGAAVLDAFADLELSSTFTVAGNVDFNGDLDVDGTTNLDVVDIDGVTTVGGNILPDANETVDIGATSTRFNDIWGSYLYIKRDNAQPVIQGIRNQGAVAANYVLLDIYGEADLGSGSAQGAQIRLVSDETWVQGSDSGAHIRFSTTANNTWDSPVERMRIDHNGNVGIGTTSPTALLDVSSSTQATGAVMRLSNTASGSTWGTGDTIGTIAFYSSDASAAGEKALIEAVQESGSGLTYPSNVALDFKTSTNNALAAAMRIDASGNVGIGTASPGTPLHVSNSVSTFTRFNRSDVSDSAWDMRIQSDKDFEIRSVTDAGTTTVNALQIAYATGNVTIAGSLSKGSGSFRIDHPLPAMSETHQLVHSFVEGPKADLIYRGSVSLVGGAATVDLDAAATMTSGTWEVLCRDPQVWVQNEDGWTQVRGSVSGSTLSIEAQDPACTDTVSWLVVAERKDPNIVGADWTDAEGRVIVEPEKPTEEASEDDGE